MRVKTIDEKIRAKALEDLENQVESAAERLRHLCRIGTKIETPLMVGSVEKSTLEALNIIVESIIRARRGKAEQKAVDAFLAKVDSIQHELDELRENIT